MYLNYIGLGLISFTLICLSYQLWTLHVLEFNPVRSGLLVPIDVNKSKHIQSKTGDASLTTERKRRKTIYTVGRSNECYIKEGTYQKGSTTGAIETYFISNIRETCIRPSTWYDGGGVDDEFDLVLDDNKRYDVFSNDAGNHDTEICPQLNYLS
jgi:hypothetical protein